MLDLNFRVSEASGTEVRKEKHILEQFMYVKTLEILMRFVTFGSILPNLPKAISSFRQKHSKSLRTSLTGFPILCILWLSKDYGRGGAGDKPLGRKRFKEEASMLIRRQSDLV